MILTSQYSLVYREDPQSSNSWSSHSVVRGTNTKFKSYIQQVKKNSKTLGDYLMEHGFNLVT